MRKNIIQILKVGNQELFYSSMIAWFLDSNGEHGLSNQFSDLMLSKIGLISNEIETILLEHRNSSIRTDILIKTKDGKKIRIENKTKSIGNVNQLIAYKQGAELVVPLGLFRENFNNIPNEFSIITYSDILGFLKSCNIAKDKFSNLTIEFIEFLESILRPFDIFHKFCSNQCSLEELNHNLESHSFFDENNNDKRFFQYIYFQRLKNYISSYVPSLMVGSLDTYYDSKKHESKPHATSWIIEKDMQGPAFMESIIYSHEIPNKLKISEKWKPFFLDEKTRSSDVSPRIELWIGAHDLTTGKEVGVFQIGSWDPNLLSAFNSSKLFSKRGSRNFHQRILSIEDLKYQKITEIMIEEMSKIWDFN
jgi:hypothetical protein